MTERQQQQRDDADVAVCGWCGTPFTAPPWCEHCGPERTTNRRDQRVRNLAGIAATREALKAARARADRGAGGE